MKRVYFIGALALSMVLASCGNSKDVTEGNQDAEVKKGVILTDWEGYKDNANTDINSVNLEGDILTLGVSYSGGCEEHSFELLGSKDVLKSMPPKRGIVLFHNSNGDSCREFIEETLTFDITDFAGGSGPIHLTLEGWDEVIVYEP